jgi:hypothetical protein
MKIISGFLFLYNLMIEYMIPEKKTRKIGNYYLRRRVFGGGSSDKFSDDSQIVWDLRSVQEVNKDLLCSKHSKMDLQILML